MSKQGSYKLVALLALLFTFVGVNAFGASDDSDKTGTNPINFTYDLKLYTELIELDPDGDKHTTTLEFRAPFLEGKWQFRARVRHEALEVGPIDESGMGDADFRILTVPHLDMENLFAMAAGLEVFLNTASEDVLGSGVTAVGPQVFFVFFNPFGIKGLFAPAYQHKISIDEDDGRSEVNQSLIDLNWLMMHSSMQYWFFTNPQIVIDHEEEKEYGIIDLEGGMMLDRFFGTKGHSAWVRPSFGAGDDSPVDSSIEVGYKIVF